jgi:hypothetical protein
MPEGQEVRHFFTKVLGVTHANDDGSSRQKVIQRLVPPEKLELIHDDENPFDPNAVKVCRANGDQVGWLAADLAEEVMSRSAEGCRYAAFATEVTGGGELRLGVNVMMVVVEPGATDEQAALYLSELDMPGFDAEVTVRTQAEPTAPASGRHSPGAAAGLLLRRWWVVLVVLALVVLVLILASRGQAGRTPVDVQPEPEPSGVAAPAGPQFPPSPGIEGEEREPVLTEPVPAEVEPGPQEAAQQEPTPPAPHVTAGMSPAEVLEILGVPEKKLSAGTAEKQLEVWTYPGGREVRFVDGALEEAPAP